MWGNRELKRIIKRNKRAMKVLKKSRGSNFKFTPSDDDCGGEN